VEDAVRRMTGKDNENVFYYLTVYNEPYRQPPAPKIKGLAEKVVRGIYRYAEAPQIKGNGDAPHVQLLASGVAVRWALHAQELLRDDWGVAADVWSVTSWNELHRDAVSAEQWNLVHAGDDRRLPYITEVLTDAPGPFVAVSDWIRAVPDQIAKWVPGDWVSLGTDGFGRSDTRSALRRYFNVDAESIATAAI